MAKPYVFVTREIPSKGLEMIREYYEVKLWTEYTPPPYDVLLEEARKADALVTLLTDKVDCNLLQNSPRLRIVAQYAVGYDNIDVDCATKLGIYVTNTPGVLTEAVADHTWGLIIALMRRIVEADHYVRSGEWYKTGTGWHPMMMLGTEVNGKTLGILGLGRIGRAVARRAKGFNMRVIYYDKYRLSPEAEKELGVEFVDLDTLFRESDILTIHTPLTSDTRHLVDEGRLRLMKRTAFLINTARGPVVDTDALVKALREGWIAGAALDVYEQEPLPPNHPLTKTKNTILTPHQASGTIETRTAMAELVARNLIAFYKGEVPPTLVNKDVVNKKKPGFE